MDAGPPPGRQAESDGDTIIILPHGVAGCGPEREILVAKAMRILISGAAGNLGTFIARSLREGAHQLRLMVHRTPLAADLAGEEVVQADLSRPDTLAGVCSEVDAIVHVAGVLFEPRPERFLHHTNVDFVRNLLREAVPAGVSRFVLVSFPQVEGETTPDRPARGRLDAEPASLHARTRLQAEREVIAAGQGSRTRPIVLRSGIVYGTGVLMIEAARWLMRRRLMAVWRQPTWYHWLALPDFLAAVRAAVERSQVEGIYHLGDDHPLTVQDGLDKLAEHWGTAKPWRFPGWSFYLAAAAVELYASLTGSAAPLHRDFIRIGMISHCGDTSRMKQDLLPKLEYPSLEHGLQLL